MLARCVRRTVDGKQWVHVNCALWSSEVYEDAHGYLVHVYKARGRGRSMRCTYCKKPGATVGCCQRRPLCKHNYHFHCAIAAGAVFMRDKRVFCSAHAPRGVSTGAGAPPAAPAAAMAPMELDVASAPTFRRIIVMPKPPKEAQQAQHA